MARRRPPDRPAPASGPPLPPPAVGRIEGGTRRVRALRPSRDMRLRSLAVVAVLEVGVIALVPGPSSDPSVLRTAPAAVLLALAALATLVVVAPSRPLASWAIQLQVMFGVALLVLVPVGAQAVLLSRTARCLVVAALIVAVLAAMYVNARRAPLWKYAARHDRDEVGR